MAFLRCERRSGPLVFHHQFGHRRALLDWNSYHDPHSTADLTTGQVNANRIDKLRAFDLFIAFRYNQDDSNDGTEESGWKLIHGDVFRPPHHPKLLVAFIGSGIQIFCMILISLRTLIVTIFV
jgi:hypothetical protein